MVELFINKEIPLEIIKPIYVLSIYLHHLYILFLNIIDSYKYELLSIHFKSTWLYSVFLKEAYKRNNK